MNVLFLDQFSEPGGGQQALLDVISAVREAGWKIVVGLPGEGPVATRIRALGAPVERGQVLFELAPLDSYRIVLQVDEDDIADVSPGQRGHLALAAMPSERFPFVVEKVIEIAQSEDGRNIFRVEARLEGASSSLRPGMKGVGKIAVERRKLWWVWSHNLVDRLGLWVWARLP